MSVDIFLGLGSNLQPNVNIPGCIKRLEQDFGSLVRSVVYESEPVGIESPNFWNMVVKANTNLPLKDLYDYLTAIEVSFGRLQGKQRSNTIPIDIDILLYGDLIGVFHGIELPRPEVLTNAFVLRPLSEIAGNYHHPITQQTYYEAWRIYDKSAQALWPVDLELNQTQTQVAVSEA